MKTPGKGRKPPPGPGPGRPIKISDPETKKKIAKLLKALRGCHFLSVAIRLSGLTESTVYNWLERGGREKSGVFRAFLEDVEKAEAAGEEMPLATLRRAASKRDVKAAAYLLERRHHKRWGKRTFRVEDEHGPAVAAGSVVPYQVRIPEVDALPAGSLAPPPQETAREEQGAAEAVKRDEHDSDEDSSGPLG